MVRLDIDREDGERRYAIPVDNPVGNGVAGAREVDMTGLRNPRRWADDAIQDDREEEGEFPGSVSSLYPAFAGELYLTTTSGGIYHLEVRR